MFNFYHFFASDRSMGGIFFRYYLRKLIGQPVHSSLKFLGWKWSYLLPQASLKQFFLYFWSIFQCWVPHIKYLKKRSIVSHFSLTRSGYARWFLDWVFFRPQFSYQMQKSGQNWEFRPNTFSRLVWAKEVLPSTPSLLEKEFWIWEVVVLH